MDMPKHARRALLARRLVVTAILFVIAMLAIAVVDHRVMSMN